MEERADKVNLAVAPENRIEWIDAVRGIALFGVLIVNLITEFRVSIFRQFLGTGSAKDGPFDVVVDRIVSLGIESKAFCLFALLFGVGLAIQFDRLSARGRPIYWLVRRLAVLLAIGLLHLLLIWNGDILTEYALAGFLVLPLLLLRPQGLLAAALGLLVLYAAGPALYSMPWPEAAILQAQVASANEVYSSGSFAEIRRFSAEELPLLLPLHMYVFPRTLALFVSGAFLWKVGLLKRANEFRSQATTAAILGIALGGALTLVDAQDSLRNLNASGWFLVALAPVLLALGYGAALMVLAQLPITGRVLSAFAPIGRMAFTNYVLQSIVFGLIFFGYWLGQFGRMDATTALAVGVTVYAVQMLLSWWWLHHYRFGPIEWLWRTLMYGVAQPMRNA